MRDLELSEGNPQIDTSLGPYASNANEKISPAASKDTYGNIKYHPIPTSHCQWNFSTVTEQSPDTTSTTYEIDNSKTSQNSAPSTCISDLSALIDKADQKHEANSKEFEGRMNKIQSDIDMFMTFTEKQLKYNSELLQRLDHMGHILMTIAKQLKINIPEARGTCPSPDHKKF